MSNEIRYIVQGEEAVGRRAGEIIATTLGSCVSICLWDPEARVGGMNHMLLPENKAGGLSTQTQGAASVERLINAMIRYNAARDRLRAKIFGGSCMLSGMTDIGGRNAAFARSYLEAEGIPCDAESTGGQKARNIRFWPESGLVRQRYVEEAPEIIRVIPAPNDVELF